MSLAITLLGHATLLLEIDGVRVVVDPFLAPNNPAATREVGSVEADFILVTHAHDDHTADLMALAQSTGAMVVANVDIGHWVNRKGYRGTHFMNTGGSYVFPFGRVKMTPAFHSSGFPDGSYGGNAGGYLISAAGRHIYLAGDTGLFSDMALISREALELAVLPIGDNVTMGPDDALLALDYLKPKYVIPYHYNTWPSIEIDVDEWSARVRSTTKVTPIVLSADERHEF